MTTKTKIAKCSDEPHRRTIGSATLGSSYQLTRTKSGVCLRQTDRRQVSGRDQLLITSLLFSDDVAFLEYCRADVLASSDPFAANQLARAFHELYSAQPE